jgi:hypothetical protein
MLRPLNEAMRLETELQRRAANFASIERQIAQGSTDSRHAAILRARDVHGYDWDTAFSYADGFYAARAGWVARPPSSSHRDQADERRLGYNQGFLDGGGQPDDIFDVARRSFAATSPQPMADMARPITRPRPSQWPSTTDAPAPASWHRRLLLIGSSEFATATIGILAMFGEQPGHEAATLLLADAESGIRALSTASGSAPGDDGTLRHVLHQRDYADILIVADDAELTRIDADADVLPLTRTMERTRNSVIQQRAQFRHWLARGRAPGVQFAGGHIRWSKMAAGLSGRLGDFTARHAGRAEPRGHRIVVEDASGDLAEGYRTAHGQELHREIVIGKKSHARSTMASLLRQYAAAIRFESPDRIRHLSSP